MTNMATDHTNSSLLVNVPWIGVNEYMHPEFRAELAEIAVKQAKTHSTTLAKLAFKLLNQSVKVSGFRNPWLKTAPVNIAAQHVVEHMQKNGRVAAVVIALWSEVCESTVEELRLASEKLGIIYETDWDWQEGIKGYYDPSKISQLETLYDCAEDLGKEKSETERNHLRLAVFWLSTAIRDPQILSLNKAKNEANDTILDTETSDTSMAYDPVNISIEAQSQPTDLAIDDTDGPQQSIDMQSSKPLVTDDFGKLQKLLTKMYSKADGSFGAVEDFAAKLLHAARESNLPGTRDAYYSLGTSIEDWAQARSSLEQFLHQLEPLLDSALQERPDLAKETGELLSMSVDAHSQIDHIIEYGNELLNKLTAYDEKRSSLWSEFKAKQLEILDVTKNLQQWDRDFIEEFNHELQNNLIENLTLQELDELVSQAQRRLESFMKRLSQFDVENEQKISRLIKAMANIEIDGQYLILPGLTINRLREISIKEILIEQRRKLEVELEKLLEDANQQGTQNITNLAQKLLLSWDENLLSEILELLCAEQRDIEVFLLVFSTIHQQQLEHPLSISANVVNSLLNALSSFSNGDEPNLMSLVAAEFFTGWVFGDEDSKLESYVLLLASYFTKSPKLDLTFLWNIEEAWPYKGMPTWSVLWQSVRDGQTVEIIDPDTIVTLKEQVDHERNGALIALGREPNNSYTRARAIDDRKYRRVLNSYLLPKVDELLQTIERLYSKSRDNIVTDKMMTQLHEKIESIEYACKQSEIDAEFNNGLNAANISDFHSFHGRTTRANYKGALEAVLTYAQALHMYFKVASHQNTQISGETLENELKSHRSYTSKVSKWLGYITEPEKYESLDLMGNLNQILCSLCEEELLTKVIYPQRLPRLLAALAGQEFLWSLTDLLLQDLADINGSISTSVDILLKNQAPAQCLLFSEQLSAQQRQNVIKANEIYQDKIEQLKTDFLKFGSDVYTTFEDDRRRGRWKLIEKKLGIQFKQLHEKTQREETEKKDYQRTLLQSLNTLRIDIFEQQDRMSEEAFNTVRSGLMLAEEAISKELLDSVEQFHTDIQYRIKHNSWDISGIQASIKALQDTIAGTSNFQREELNCEELLNALKARELSRVGINETNFRESKIETRIEILQNWLWLKNNLKGFRTEQTSETEKTMIRSFYSSFARMIVMGYESTVNNKPSVYDDPVIYSVYRLTIPRTAALNRAITFLVLSGHAFRADNQNFLEELLNGKEWLKTGFIVLFVPGISTRVINNLKARFFERNLAVIDELDLVRILLAESESLLPVSIFRPLLINSKGGQNVDVFKVNQKVDNYSSIFVGRERLIDRIVYSGDNYVIYGGRRIGKTSVLLEIQDRLRKNGVKVVYRAIDSDTIRSDSEIARSLAKELDIQIKGISDFKDEMQKFMTSNPKVQVAILMDEFDAYITDNPNRQVLIQSLRDLSDQYGDRFRAIIAGFMKVYDHIKGRGPYTSTSDPWIRMFTGDQSALLNLDSSQAEQIVQIGFREILGWKFENHRIPQLIVERTGGHPAFVQYFCLKIQENLGTRRIIRVSDVEKVFNDEHPDNSFIAHVKNTLGMNIDDPFGEFLLAYLASENEERSRFSYELAKECAQAFAPYVTSEHFHQVMERLIVTGVIRAYDIHTYEFTVPDYPSILRKFSGSKYTDQLERRIKEQYKDA